ALNRTPGYPRPHGQLNTYAVSLFKGILQRDPHEFRFYRAKGFNPGTGSTLAMSAFYDNGLAAYFGDLTDIYPMR
ncbi:MAG: hypothetical protein K8F30_14735, partial [Taibaiella sp.]|nr:hypothetical protein [Taibaiella sp.]